MAEYMFGLSLLKALKGEWFTLRKHTFFFHVHRKPNRVLLVNECVSCC